MSNEHQANVMFARHCLQSLCRDLTDTEARSLCMTLDRDLRLGDFSHFEATCSSLSSVVGLGGEPWQVKERIQAISLIRFPLHRLDPKQEFQRQRDAVVGIRTALIFSDKEILKYAGKLVSNILLSAKPEPADFRHGPGVVAETSNALRKRTVCWLAPSLRQHLASLPEFPIRWREAPSRSLLVPKDHKSLRVIAAEPTWTQWVQQGYKAAIMRCVERSPIFRSHIKFDDQKQQHARLTAGMATIDLSNASDTIRVKHLLLMQLPLACRELLLSMRTVATEFQGGLFPTVGLFPMGAAVCFPLETLIFASLWVAYRKFERKSRDLTNWGVFGDDIVIPNAYAGGFVTFLERCGFRPNRGKTFICGDFLESCGVYSYKGIDVTPVKIKKPPPVSSKDVSNITYREYVGRLEMYPLLKRRISGRILDPLYTQPQIRWNPAYQRLEQKTLRFKVPCVTGHWSGYPEALLRGSCDIPQPTITVGCGWEPL